MIDHKEEAKAPAVDGRHLSPAPPPPSPPRRRSKAWLWLLLLAAAAGFGYRTYRNNEQKKAAAAEAQERRAANRTIPVAAVAAKRGDLPIYLRGLGSVEPYNTVNVRSRVEGPIVTVLFQEGQEVVKGQPLVKIDPRTFQAAVDQAKGQLARDQAQLRDAQANLARYQKLWEAGVIARQQLDTQAAQVGQFQGVIEADQAAIETAQLQLSFTDVTAPIAGRIGLRQVDVGNIVHPTDQNPIAIITQMEPIAVLFTIPADNLQPVLAKLRAGTRPPVEAWDRSDTKKIASGTLATVDNQIDPQTGTSRLKAVFPNQDRALFPQQFVNARMLLETRRGAVLIPTSAVQRGQHGSYVYLVTAGGTASMRPIALGATEGNTVQVTKGLAPGDQIVVDGQDKLQEGMRVEVRPQSGGPDRLTQTDAVTGTGGKQGQGNQTGHADRTATPDASGVPAGRPSRGGSKGPAQ